ncbi:MAG: RNA methyltransferase [Candidatus Aminicenantes bacterium]|nr:RNA methyltransferase [Candidatus Aminicenantes bacterium]
MSDRTDESFLKSHCAVILVEPENQENIGLVARAMKNTGFSELRFVGLTALGEKSFVTAVHAKNILESGLFFSNLEQALKDCEVVFASTSKKRKEFSSLTLNAAVDTMLRLPRETKIGLVFGNERTGLTSRQLRNSNFRFEIPQATSQPSYNLASAVLVTLFQIYCRESRISPEAYSVDKPMAREDQEDCIRRILLILEEKGFVHKTNKKHVQDRIYDLFGRMTLTEKDRSLLLALFSKGVGSKK